MRLSFPRIFAAAVAVLAVSASSAPAHELWILTPAEIEALAAEPIPALFTSRLWLGLAGLAGILLAILALRIEEMSPPVAERSARILSASALSIGPAVLRLAMALMLALAATGGLPRHGTPPWQEPTLLVPDMQLGLVGGWDWLAALQLLLALLLLIGLATRLAGLALIALSLLGIGIFGPTFLAYAPHFAAPGLMLALAGGGRLSVDHVLRLDGVLRPAAGLMQPGWRLAQLLIGGGFVYLGVAFKLTQPTLIMAILDHGGFPTFGLPLPVIALVMTGVEILCGGLIALGRLIRPVALAMICAISLLAATLGETPLFHANLYGMMLFLFLAGRELPVSAAGTGRIAA